MTDAKSSTDSTEEELIVSKLCQDLHLIQKVIIKEKVYAKEAIRQEIYRECISILEKLLGSVKGNQFYAWS